MSRKPSLSWAQICEADTFVNTVNHGAENFFDQKNHSAHTDWPWRKTRQKVKDEGRVCVSARKAFLLENTFLLVGNVLAIIIHFDRLSLRIRAVSILLMKNVFFWKRQISLLFFRRKFYRFCNGYRLKILYLTFRIHNKRNIIHRMYVIEDTLTHTLVTSQ